MNLTVGKRIFLGFLSLSILILIMGVLNVFGVSSIIKNADEVIVGNKLKGDVVAREVDHLNWTSALNKLLTDDDVHEFKGGLDHTKCKFGKWLYGSDRQFIEERLPVLVPILNKIEKPHEDLHATAKEILGTYQKTIFGMKEFIIAKENDHLAWTNKVFQELVEQKTSLSVQLDPTKCGFGKFLLSEKLTHLLRVFPEAESVVEKIVEVHKKLHGSAKGIKALMNKSDFVEAKSVMIGQTLKHLSSVREELNNLSKIIDKKDKGYQKAKEIYSKQTVKHLASVQKLLHEIVDTTTNNIMTDAEMLSAAKRTNATGVTIVIIGVILGLILAFTITRVISKPLNFLSEQLDRASNEVSQASGEVASSSQSIAEMNSEQASSIEEISASLEEISGMAKNNVQHAKDSERESDEVFQYSNQGQETVEGLVKAMKEILESTKEIENLSHIIKEIGDKTSIIDEIVFETKLLSFNASVEAERAGEHGRGFAVVAQEVGKLAQMSGKAATEISSIVKDSISQVDGIITNNKDRVDRGNDLVLATKDLLEKIRGLASTVSDSSRQISGASTEQANGIEQINSAIHQLDQVTQKNAASSEEIASSGEELGSLAKSLDGMVRDLINMVRGDKA